MLHAPQKFMPGPVAGVSTAPWRRWASKLDRIVTDDGATIDFYGDRARTMILLTAYELSYQVTDDDVIRLLTFAVELTVTLCSKLTDAAIFAVADTSPTLPCGHRRAVPTARGAQRW